MMNEYDPQDKGSEPDQEPRAEAGPEEESGDDQLTAALEATLAGLNDSIRKMEAIVQQIEAGDPDWEENIKLLTEANELAVGSSQQLDQVVQDVVYGDDEDTSAGTEEPEATEPEEPGD